MNEQHALRTLTKRYNTWPLSAIRSIRAREIEREARLKAVAMGDSDDEPGYELVRAPGCHGYAFAPTVGYVWSRAAAEDLAGQLTHMPGGTSHRSLAIA